MKHVYKIGIMVFTVAVVAAAIAAGCAGAPPRTEASASGIRAADQASKDKANADLQKQQAETVAQGKQDLKDSEARTAEVVAQGKQDLKNSEARTAEVAAQGKQDLSDSEKRTNDALDELVKLVAVREEERGLVITLSGSILFRSGDAVLLPSAQVKLDRVAEALLAVRARKLIVEGHTDSQGSDRDNLALSQGRADAVRDYLVQRSYPADRIEAYGMGEGRPIADNASAEGRANNRRVEIIIERELQPSSQ